MKDDKNLNDDDDPLDAFMKNEINSKAVVESTPVETISFEDLFQNKQQGSSSNAMTDGGANNDDDDEEEDANYLNEFKAALARKKEEEENSKAADALGADAKTISSGGGAGGTDKGKDLYSDEEDMAVSDFSHICIHIITETNDV